MIKLHDDGSTVCPYCRQLIEPIDLVGGVVVKSKCFCSGDCYHLACYLKKNDQKNNTVRENPKQEEL